MKKTLLITLTIVLTSLSGFAQQFEITPDGLRDSSDTSKDFIVILGEGKTASDLYKISKRYVNEMMYNPKFAIQADVDGEYLRYSVFAPEAFSFSKMLVKLKVNASYIVEMKFRDDRIRYNILALDLTFEGGDNPFYISAPKMKGWAFYNGKGKLLMENEKVKLETYFNEEVKKLVDYIQTDGGSVNEDW